METMQEFNKQFIKDISLKDWPDRLEDALQEFDESVAVLKLAGHSSADIISARNYLIQLYKEANI